MRNWEGQAYDKTEYELQERGMKAYRMVTDLPSGNKIESSLFKWRRSAELLAADRTIKLMHDIVKVEPRVVTVDVTLWKWLTI